MKSYLKISAINGKIKETIFSGWVENRLISSGCFSVNFRLDVVEDHVSRPSL